MRFAGNFLENNGGVAMGQSLTALTALQTLDLSRKALYLVALSGVSFEVCDGVLARVGCVWVLLYRRCVLQGTFSKTMLLLLLGDR